MPSLVLCCVLCALLHAISSKFVISCSINDHTQRIIDTLRQHFVHNCISCTRLPCGSAMAWACARVASRQTCYLTLLTPAMSVIILVCWMFSFAVHQGLKCTFNDSFFSVYFNWSHIKMCICKEVPFSSISVCLLVLVELPHQKTFNPFHKEVSCKKYQMICVIICTRHFTEHGLDLRITL